MVTSVTLASLSLIVTPVLLLVQADAHQPLRPLIRAHADDFAAAAASLIQPHHSPVESSVRRSNGGGEERPSLASSAVELIEELVMTRRVREDKCGNKCVGYMHGMETTRRLEISSSIGHGYK